MRMQQWPRSPGMEHDFRKKYQDRRIRTPHSCTNKKGTLDIPESQLWPLPELPPSTGHVGDCARLRSSDALKGGQLLSAQCASISEPLRESGLVQPESQRMALLAVRTYSGRRPTPNKRQRHSIGEEANSSTYLPLRVAGIKLPKWSVVSVCLALTPPRQSRPHHPAFRQAKKAWTAP